MNGANRLEWISTGGGPLLLIPQKSLTLWEGSHKPSAGRVVEAKFRWHSPDDPATDYDRAVDLSLSADLAILELGSDNAIVLGDEPSSTSWWPINAENGLIVRRIYAENDDAIISCLNKIPREIWESTNIAFNVPDCPLIIFDSAYPGSLIEDNCLIFSISEGVYSIETCFFRPDDETGLVLHRLSRRY